MTELDDLLDTFGGIALTALDERAALLLRIDNKYVVGWESFLELARGLRDQHDVLEIDHRRAFGYSTTYFDTPDLRCFDVDRLIGLVEYRRGELQTEAMYVGQRLYGEKPKAFERRIHVC